MIDLKKEKKEKIFKIVVNYIVNHEQRSKEIRVQAETATDARIKVLQRFDKNTVIQLKTI